MKIGKLSIDRPASGSPSRVTSDGGWTAFEKVSCESLMVIKDALGYFKLVGRRVICGGTCGLTADISDEIVGCGGG